MSQLVAYNMSAFRKAAGLSQQELGERVGGWSAASVSAAERSWDSRRIKVFDADDIAKIADALGVQLIDQGARQLLDKIDRRAGERQDREAAASREAERAAVGARARSAALERQ